MPRPRKPAGPFLYFNSSPEVIRLVVMMYVRFPLSLRNVEDLLFERGINICHETVRMWWNRFDENVGVSAGLHILAGSSPQALANEAQVNAEQWRLTNYAAWLANRPVLMVTSDDGFAAGSDPLADAIRTLDGARLTIGHFATDHSYSDCRIGLQVAVLDWLASF